MCIRDRLEGHVINLSDQIAVKINLGNAIFDDNGGVIFFPVDVTFDGGDHFGFDLTHEREEKGQGREGRDPLHSLKIVDFGVCAKKLCHFPDRTRAAAILNKKCILRIGTVSVNEAVAVSQPQAHYDPPLQCECGSKDTVAYM